MYFQNLRLLRLAFISAVAFIPNYALAEEAAFELPMSSYQEPVIMEGALLSENRIDTDSDPTRISRKQVCRQQLIAESSFEPDAYEVQEVSSPHAQDYSFRSVSGSLEFAVQMPTGDGSSRPYVLGPDGDFYGIAEICTTTDEATGLSFDEVVVQLRWNGDSGGAYNVLVRYTPYGGSEGSAEPITRQTVYVVDGGVVSPEKKNSTCLSGAGQEIGALPNDLVVTPAQYASDKAVGLGRGYYAGRWHYVSTIANVIDLVNRRVQATRQRVKLLFLSHGNIDTWIGFQDEMRPNLAGNSSNVSDLGAGLAGKVSEINFFSCCTAKKFALRQSPNVISSLSAASQDPDGSYRPRVCGFSHQLYAWFREGKFHLAMTHGDARSCTP